MSNTQYSVYLLLLLAFNSYQCFARTLLGEPYYVYGVGPVCRNSNTNKSNVFEQQAKYHDVAAQRFFYENDVRSYILKYRKLYQYVHVDVCEGSDSLLDFLVEVLLNPKYTITEDPSTKARRKITQWKYQSKILMIFAFLTDEMFVRLAGILSQTDILVMNLRANIQFHQNLYVVPSRFVSVLQENKHFLGDLITVLNWRYITIVTFEDKLSSSSQDYLQQYKRLFLDMGICFNVETFVYDAVKAKQVVERLQTQQDNDVILLVGATNRQIEFTDLVRFSNKTWILSDNHFADYVKNDVGSIITIEDGFTPALYEITLVNAHATMLYISFSSEDKQLYSFNYLTKLYQYMLILHNAYKKRAFTATDLVTLKKSMLSSTEDVVLTLKVDKEKIISNNAIYNIQSLSSSLSNYKTRSNASSKCPLVECEPGREYIFKRLEVNETQWNESYQWSCQLCAPGFYKRNYGNSSCQQCPVHEISNERRDSCYDPYTLKTISFQQPFSIIAISLAGFGVCCCLVVFIGFIKFRTTPMMKAADVNMTMAHLFIITCNLVVQPFFYMGKPVMLKCYGRLLTITVCYTLTNAVILWRSQKVLSVFQRRVIMNAKQVKKAKFTQFAGMSTLVVTANLLMAVLILREPVRIIEEWDYEHFEKTFYCNTWQHSIGLVTFSICLQFVCFVQAFRGRRLPGAFKETMSIVYGSFITIVVFFVVFPIVFFHKDVLGRDSVYWIAVTFNLDILVMFCYFRRVYVAVFLPEMNTVEYSRSVIMAKMSKDSKNRIRTS